jgi:hypothetical protein
LTLAPSLATSSASNASKLYVFCAAVDASIAAANSSNAPCTVEELKLATETFAAVRSIAVAAILPSVSEIVVTTFPTPPTYATSKPSIMLST